MIEQEEEEEEAEEEALVSSFYTHFSNVLKCICDQRTLPLLLLQ
jgi:hypothetical protein